jgi:hypothetical protein
MSQASTTRRAAPTYCFKLQGRRGDDLLRVRDGEPDAPLCGPGVDRVKVDRLDFIAGDCEHRPKRARAAATLLFVSDNDVDSAGFGVSVGHA